MLTFLPTAHVASFAVLDCRQGSCCACAPYVQVRLGARRHSTVVRAGSSRPVWNQTFCFTLTAAQVACGRLRLVVKNKDPHGTDEVLGELAVPLAGVGVRAVNPTEEEEAQCQSFPGALSRVCRVYAAGYSGMMELAAFCGVPGGVALGRGTPFKAPSRSAGIGFGPQLSLSWQCRHFLPASPNEGSFCFAHCTAKNPGAPPYIPILPQAKPY